MYEKLLSMRDTLFSVKFGENPVVIAAPHHGIECETFAKSARTPRDINTGRQALALAKFLRGKAVIFSNVGVISPDSSNSERFLEEVFLDCPELVLELHGHSGSKTPFDVEIATQGNPASPRFLFAYKLEENYCPSGCSPLKLGMEERDKIVYTAPRSEVLRVALGKGLPAYHLEIHIQMRHYNLERACFEDSGERFLFALGHAIEQVHPQFLRGSY